MVSTSTRCRNLSQCVRAETRLTSWPSWWFFTNPFGKYARQIGSFPPGFRGEHKKMKPPTRLNVGLSLVEVGQSGRVYNAWWWLRVHYIITTTCLPGSLAKHLEYSSFTVDDMQPPFKNVKQQVNKIQGKDIQQTTGRFKVLNHLLRIGVWGSAFRASIKTHPYLNGCFWFP